MNALPTRASITLGVMVLLLSFSFLFNLSHVQGQSLPRCPRIIVKVLKVRLVLA
jgi:hypothetical protein